MVNRFFTPDAQFFADPVTGEPLIGGLLYFYVTGSSTPLNTYQENTLATPNTNPVVLDSSGFAGNIFLQNAAYKVVLTDADGTQIWTADPVWSSDYSTVAQFACYNGNPNGHVAGTAGTVGGLPSSVIWDYTNNILYVCTTTGTATTAVWTAVNSTATQNVSPPQGYLTPVSGTPIITSDATSATSFYYTPYIGNLVPIYNGTSFILNTFNELTAALSASQAANTIYDVFVFLNSGVVTLGIGPAWSTSTAGSGARGTGAGTTQISRLNGLWVNSVQISAKNGATTYTIAANQATYLGSVFIDSSAGQITCTVTWGQSRKWALWNAYNRSTIVLQGGDVTASWSYSTNTIRAANGDANNKVTVFSGLAEERYDLSFGQFLQDSVINTSGEMVVGVGFNSTTAFSGTLGHLTVSSAQTETTGVYTTAQYDAPPSLGVNNIQACENTPVTSGTETSFGTQSNMLLRAVWRG